jgi:hypothetical protein
MAIRTHPRAQTHLRARTHLLAAAVLAAVALPLAACGSGTASASSASSKRDAMLTFAQCMRTHGVPNFPDPGSNGSGGIMIQQRAGSGASMSVNGVAVQAPAFQAAMQSCRKDLPNGGHPPPLSASRRAAMLRFSQCMRAHGVTNFPDPTFGQGGGVRIGFGPSSGINPQSPAFQAAQKACGGLGGPKAIAAGP